GRHPASGGRAREAVTRVRAGRVLRAALLRGAALVALAAPAAAQGPADTAARALVLDRVLAVVGTRAVLQSHVDEQLFLELSREGAAPLKTRDDSAAARRRIVSELIDEELMVQEAQRDTAIKVTDEEVTDAVEQNIRNVRNRFSSEREYLVELRKTGFLSTDEYRRWLNENQRRELLRNRLLEKLKGKGDLKPINPTDREMRAYFEESKGQLGQRPATLAFRQIVVAPQADSAAKSRAFALADSIAGEIRRGADFATAAKRFSQDPGTKEQGGSLGWTRRGAWVPEFERVAFGIRPGTVSYPVESPFGYHVIQVERTQPGEVLARHILIVPEVTATQVDAARKLADSVRAMAAAGASWDSLAKLYHDRGEEQRADEVPADRLPPIYARPIGQTETGQVTPVVVLQQGDREKFAVVKVAERRAAGEIRYEDVKEQIRRRLSDQFSIRRYLDGLRRRTHVDIRLT
ncbi:MAG: peptidylprolyl isomerase, partial [Gemmatimonadales bacterium]|nr:peptidylprolyl isomerase [Gemmatimonadales bacterium]